MTSSANVREKIIGNAMNMLPYRLRRWLATSRHNRAIAAVEHTPPLRPGQSGLAFLSMLRHGDVRMYLVAIKSVFARLGPASITIVDDGSLTGADRALLDRHLGNVRYIPVDQVDTGGCPRGGCWERLVAILDLARDHYVIQLDADIVALGDLTEVAECVRDNRAFTLAAGEGAFLETAGETSALTRGWGEPDHVQAAAEEILDRLPGAASLRYIRGCAAFAGFPRGSDNRGTAFEFSGWMQKYLGQRWNKWGSEQVTSNFLIANSADPLVLPWSKYRSYAPGNHVTGARLIHFFGTYRFENAVYTEQSRRAIADLMRNG